MHDSSFKKRHFVRSETLATRAKEQLKLNNTTYRLSIILSYSEPLYTFECLIYQIYQ